MRASLAVAAVALLTVASARGFAASTHRGLVTIGGQPVPGATVTASRDGADVVTTTDPRGVFTLADLADGSWSVRVEMLGCSPLVRDIVVPTDSAPSTWALSIVPFETLAREATLQTSPPPAGGAPTAAPVAGTASTPRAQGFQRAESNAAVSNRVTAADPQATTTAGASPAGGTSPADGADGFLVNGSVNNGAASPFAQLAAFGNNRRGTRSLYNGGIGVLFGDSAWDARPFSFTGQQGAAPDYRDVQVVSTFGGPLKIPGLPGNAPNLFLGYQRTSDHNASEQSALVPTLLERGGDFSHSMDASGRPVQIIDPATGRPFPGNVIPVDRLSPQARALLAYYPAPNVAGGRFNFETPVVLATHQDSVQARLTEALSNQNQLFGNLLYQRATTETGNVFGFVDASRTSSLDAAINWSHRFSPLASLRLRYQFTRNGTDVTPYFADRANVSGDAGITGNNQDPANWGPPSLIFSSGVAGFAGAPSAANTSLTHAWTAEGILNRGRHAITIGGDLRRQQLDVLSQQNAQGTFSFTGSATGSDVADFLLGLPHASSVGFGNADKFLRGFAYDAYVNDDWRISPGVTVNAGLRWELEMPLAERFGRLANLDVAPGFTAAQLVTASQPVGALSGMRYPAALLHADWRGLQPRIGVAWRPVAGSSLVVRAGYGVYRNNGTYQSIGRLLAEQPPFSTALSVESRALDPLTLANGFTGAGAGSSNTFAVDPDLRVGSSQNWQVSAQRDLPGSLTMIATYLGTKGSHLMQETLPNTEPVGAINPCPACPSGFVYLTSNGRSSRQAAQFQLRRRLRNGVTASAQYTFSKADDDAAAFTGVGLTGNAIAQDWRHPQDDWGPSNFDQRHQLAVQVQYTTGMGIGGGARLDGIRGSLFKGWTVTSQLTAGSGLPLTPVSLTPVAGTAFTGSIRASLTGASPDAAPSGFTFNPAAYSAPLAGQWGTAGRNSIVGPSQFALNASLGRSFLWGDRLNLDWRIDATNLLNRVTYAGVNTIVGSPQFGLPDVANPMRKLQTSLRLRF